MEIIENIQKLCVLMGSQTGCLSERSSTVIEKLWSGQKQKVRIIWCGVLKEKHLFFFTITTTNIEKYSFHRIIKRLEARFGVKELTETSKAKFRQAYQKPEES